MYNYNPAQNNVYGNNMGMSARPQAKNTQPLTQQQIDHLVARNGAKHFDLRVSEDDLLISACTHRQKNGENALINVGGNRWRCTICNEEFNMFDGSVDDVRAAVENMKDILQTLKSMYLDMPDEVALKYMQMISLLDKLPGLYEAGIANFDRYENFQTYAYPNSNGGYSNFATMNNLLTGQFMNPAMNQGGYMGQPMMPGMVPQQPMMAGQMYVPQPTAGYMQPQQPMMRMDQYTNNPLAYAPATQPAPVAPAPAPAVGAVPTAPAPTATTPAPAAQTEVQQTSTFNV